MRGSSSSPGRDRLSAPASVDQGDLQGNVLCGYGNSFPHGLYAFVQVGDGAAGRRLLGELAEQVTDAVPWRTKPERTVNVALTHIGLANLGVREELLRSFPPEFQAGMGSRAGQLGDTGRSSPDCWDEGLRPGKLELLVTSVAQSPGGRARLRDWLRRRVAPEPGLSIVNEQEADLLGNPAENEAVREHFGFADGLCQPTIEDERAGPNYQKGRGTPMRFGRWADLAPGEFVLGYRDEDGLVADAPAEPLRQSGTFTVVRKLYQDVGAFNSYLSEAAQRRDIPEELLAAKIVGRWRNGAPLSLAPDREDPSLTMGGKRQDRLNDFRYSSDGKGLKCPIGAHIRRANPRDALGWRGALSKRHRIIRRGMPYGPRFEDRPAQLRDADRGLMFVCYQASIERQFELVQARWLADGDAFGLGSDRDPLVTEDPNGKMTVQGKPPKFLASLPSFVTTKGGDYFFTPGVKVLRALASGELGGA